MPIDRPPPRDSRFGSPLVLSRVHWVRPELQCSNQRHDLFLSDGMPLVACGTVDLALDSEDLVDTANRFDRQWHLPQIGRRCRISRGTRSERNGYQVIGARSCWSERPLPEREECAEWNSTNYMKA
jgi:hypothetical protein